MIGRPLKVCLISALLILLLFPFTGRPGAVAQEEGAKVSASMNAYYYAPGGRAYLDVDLDLPPRVRGDTISLDLLIYPSAITRSYLASFREEVHRYPIARRTLETIPPEAEWTDKEYEIDLNALGLPAGVYPFEVRLTQDGEKLAYDYNFLVIMGPGGGYPLNLSLLWTLDFLPTYDAQGNELDGGLAAACSSSPSETGFLYALAKVLKRTPEVRSNMILPGTTYQDLETLAVRAKGEGSGDREKGAAEVLALLDDMFKGGQVDLVTTSYTFADLDPLAALGWEDDAAKQMELGSGGAGDTGAAGKGFVSPLFHLSDDTLQRIKQNGLEFTVVGGEAVQSSDAGKRLLEGTTLSQPVNFANQNGDVLKAFVRDEALYRYLEGTTQRDAPHMVQSIIAELAVLQREKPYAIRSCVLAFPPSFVPSKEFLEGLYNSLKGCPWLQTRFLSELNRDQFALEGVTLQAPLYGEAPSSYDQRLEAVRNDARSFSSALPEGHPLIEELARDILIAENYRFMEEKDVAAAQKYLDSINALIGGEVSRVKIEKKRSVTLSSTQGNLSVDITSGLDYPITATLRLENASLSFPEGNAKNDVIIEPRENHFTFSVNTHRKGSFIVDITLESGGLVLDQTSTAVNTSIINTLAIILLACFAFIVALVVAVRRLSARLRKGKHSKGRGSR